MAEMKDCQGKLVKICKSSITIKDENGKTCGVVRDITRFSDVQPNKQFEIGSCLRKMGVAKWVDMSACVMKGTNFYFLRNVKSKLFHEKHGFFSDEEKQRYDKTNEAYEKITAAGLEVIECTM